jgi:hypothetical protein
MADEKNEFEELETEETVPEQEFSTVPGGQESMIAAGSAGTKYDWTKAPEGIKAPPRIDLNGKQVTIKKADIILPPLDKEWQKTKDGQKDFKYCSFVLFYDIENQQEFYSGMRVFKREEGKYSHPTITRDRKNQSSILLGLYADFKNKDINEVSLREFLAFLNSQPKAKIKTDIVKNPQTGEQIKKNFVGTFIGP